MVVVSVKYGVFITAADASLAATVDIVVSTVGVAFAAVAETAVCLSVLGGASIVYIGVVFMVAGVDPPVCACRDKELDFHLVPQPWPNPNCSLINQIIEKTFSGDFN